jgi:hypothetical protein
MPVAPHTRFNVRKLQPAVPGSERESTVRLPGVVNWVAGQVLGIVTGTAVNAVQRLTFTGTVTGGTFRLVWGQELTDPIAWNATAATLAANIQSAMDGLVGAGNSLVSGTGPFDVTFQNELAGRRVPLPAVVNALTGTSPVVTPTFQAVGHPGGGQAEVYNNGAADGTEVARLILMQDTQTDLRGNVITDRPGVYPSAPVYTAGQFFTADLVGLDAAGVTDLGRLVNAPTVATAGAILAVIG